MNRYTYLYRHASQTRTHVVEAESEAEAYRKAPSKLVAYGKDWRFVGLVSVEER